MNWYYASVCLKSECLECHAIAADLRPYVQKKQREPAGTQVDSGSEADCFGH